MFDKPTGTQFRLRCGGYAILQVGKLAYGRHSAQLKEWGQDGKHFSDSSLDIVETIEEGQPMELAQVPASDLVSELNRRMRAGAMVIEFTPLVLDPIIVDTESP